MHLTDHIDIRKNDNPIDFERIKHIHYINEESPHITHGASMFETSFIRVAGIIEESITDGPGLRTAVFLQGCGHHCEGCHNPETHDFSAGTAFDPGDLYEEICKNPLIRRVTFTGGDPVYQMRQLMPVIKLLHRDHFHLMLYTGFTAEELFTINPPGKVLTKVFGMGDRFPWDTEIYDRAYFLSMFNVIITDRFDITKRSMDLRFRGSSNQRVWRSEFSDVPSACESTFRLINITEEWDDMWR